MVFGTGFFEDCSDYAAVLKDVKLSWERWIGVHKSIATLSSGRPSIYDFICKVGM